MRTERRPLFGFLFRLLWRISVVWAVVSGFAHLPVIYRYAEEAFPWLRPAAYSGTVAHYWAAAAMLCSMLDTCASCWMGWVKLRTYWIKAWISPMVMMPLAAKMLPTMATAT